MQFPFMIAHSHFNPGEEVIVQPLNFCSKCDYCQRGMENYCSDMNILGENSSGTQCEFIKLKSFQLRKKPPHLSFQDACAFPLSTQTAYAMLVKRAKIKPGESVFVWGAGSGVGTMAIQIANYFGCKVYASAGTDKKIRLAKKLGAAHAWNYKTKDILNMIKEHTRDRGIDVVFEHVGKSTWNLSKKMLAVGGRLVTCGATTGYDVSLDLRHLFMKQQSVMGSTMSDINTFDEMLSLVNDKVIVPVVDKVFQMKDVKEAHNFIESSGPNGKVVLLT